MDEIKQKLQTSQIVPFIGLGVFENSGLPYNSDSFILAMNDGKPMAARLMYEYSRAAMNIEQKRGRTYLEELVKKIYTTEYKAPKIYELLSQTLPKYVIDVNIDDSLQKAYSKVEHFLILGKSRVLGDGFRFEIYSYDGSVYKLINNDKLNGSKPILFKPMGSLIPTLSLIVSDADFVDWLTEAMGGYAIPSFLKEYRKNKEYMFIGIDFSKDTFRMVANELTTGLDGGVYFTSTADISPKIEKYLQNHNLKVKQNVI